VRGFSVTDEGSSTGGPSTKVLRFRVDQFDDDGNLVRQIPVEMRGRSFTGLLENGFQVSVAGHWVDGRVVSKQVTVYRDGVVMGIVRTSRPGPPPWQIVVMVLLVVAFVSFVVWGIIHMQNLRDQQPKLPIAMEVMPSGVGHIRSFLASADELPQRPMSASDERTWDLIPPDVGSASRVARRSGNASDERVKRIWIEH
jgi:hypothetical protein